MVRMGLSIVLVIGLASSSVASERPKEGEGASPNAACVPVRYNASPAKENAAKSSTPSIAKPNRAPDVIQVEVCVAELLLPAQEPQAGKETGDDSRTSKAPSMESDGAAWFAWAKNQGRLTMLAHPCLVTLDNHPACVRVGQNVPTASLERGKDAGEKENPNEQTFVGVSVGVTPRISASDQIVLELDIERSSLVKPEGEARPFLEKTAAQTTITVKDGKMAVVSGLVVRSKKVHQQTTVEERRQTIIAVTAQINPKR